ncbi:hypothetical protein CCHR01_12391 [Colletotrichum chrysophilum]|uniref:Uncharacterized protein n=1 Tax=Colletotrichum chrysophilum TaxID=1836956 RepID=A0AAD9EBG4_9PEZI|nr:hypothetical protein CCHR01_12391 [Colletotrichum chrysophilum]
MAGTLVSRCASLLACQCASVCQRARYLRLYVPGPGVGQVRPAPWGDGVQLKAKLPRLSRQLRQRLCATNRKYSPYQPDAGRARWVTEGEANMDCRAADRRGLIMLLGCRPGRVVDVTYPPSAVPAGVFWKRGGGGQQEAEQEGEHYRPLASSDWIPSCSGADGTDRSTDGPQRAIGADLLLRRPWAWYPFRTELETGNNRRGSGALHFVSMIEGVSSPGCKPTSSERRAAHKTEGSAQINR